MITNIINIIKILQPSNFNIFFHGYFLQFIFKGYSKLVVEYLLSRRQHKYSLNINKTRLINDIDTNMFLKLKKSFNAPISNWKTFNNLAKTLHKQCTR